MCGEERSWLNAMIIMVTLSLAVMLIQGVIGRKFDVAFEVCIFHIPALILVAIYVWLKRFKSVDILRGV